MARERRGRRVVLAVFGVVVSLAGIFGYVVGLIRPDDLQSVTYLGVLTFEPTPVGLAAWGMLTVGSVLSVGLGLVVLASRFGGVERTG